MSLDWVGKSHREAVTEKLKTDIEQLRDELRICRAATGTPEYPGLGAALFWGLNHWQKLGIGGGRVSVGTE